MRDFERKLLLLAMGTLAGLAVTVSPASAAEAAAPDRERDAHFEYHTVLGPFDPSAKSLEAWIPLPRDDANQKVTGLSVDTPAEHEIVMQTSNGNRLVHLEASAPLPASIPVTITFNVMRHEEAADKTAAERNLPEPKGGSFAAVLGPDRLVPVTGRIEQVSSDLGDNGASAYQQARIIYEYVTEVMKYDKSGTGWGRGDALYACDVRRGNCTDFHSLFIALARARGIPARFTIGFPLGKHGGDQIPGYHCWAEFYAGGVWVPVDASEAWKHPALHNYYFGHLDADRVAFTMGRDLELKPHQHGEPINFLIYPYVEVDGAPLAKSAVKTSFSYSDFDGASASH
ncbi:MAG TPA: transglutaminase domain-containing protein [Candidatus Binataceae bacterium]